MKEIVARLAIGTLGLCFGVLACSIALVLALSYGATFDRLVWPTLVGAGIAAAAALAVFMQARAFTGELARLRKQGASAVQPEDAPVLTFAENRAFFAELRALSKPKPKPAASTVPRKEDALSLRIRFVAAMGHDLRTPLNAVLGFADLLSMDRHREWNAQQEKSLGILRERTRDLISLIDAMIDWARLEAGDLTLKPAEHDVRELIERAVQQAIDRSGARGLQVNVELSSDLGLAKVDAERFVQAILGLMDHASRADNSPSLTLRARREPYGSAGALFVRVDVIDAQLEIRNEDREHMFEAFRPSFAPTGRRIAGLRLGTAIARSLMRAQGGDVWFERRPERGTTFALVAPAVR